MGDPQMLRILIKELHATGPREFLISYNNVSTSNYKLGAVFKESEALGGKNHVIENYISENFQIIQRNRWRELQ